MIFKRLVLGPLSNNVYILGDPESREGIVIDASFEPEKIAAEIKKLQLQIRTILLTHGHFDHIAGAAELKNATGGKIAIAPDDLWLYENIALQGELFGLQTHSLPEPDLLLKEGDELSFGPHRVKILQTPGHSPGSVCGRWELDGRTAVLTGDTLFAGSIGRTDLWGGDLGEIQRSIRGKLFTMEAQALVLPGHGPDSKIGEEKASNPFVGDLAQ